ncbi:hypothetical protein SASPL_133574 [Salvia splendens]|uniref:Bet v I/Major latex protein domain-containing protein n=1 Tax=Salvia splendens TaxID=180675 RepID=A0A8X8X5C0_SALSN|nr:major allergen Pru ar 1-like [Salvia splendens]KAG6405978.1 hypothetical protein SASPL_133574 [Salvia splendens]
MGSVIVDELQISSAIPPARLFKSFIIDSDNLMLKVLPGFFKSFETIHGDGGAGTVKLITWAEGDQIKSAKHRTDEIDEANRVFKYTLIEGGALEDDFELISYDMKVEDDPDVGCVYKVTSKYHTKGDNQNVIQEKIKQGHEGAKAFFHAVEAYLQANPNEYN